MKPITPCLWFDRDAEAAATLYTSLFPKSRIVNVSRYGEGQPLPAGTALVVSFEINGQPHMALNGGPMFKHSEAFSLVVYCRNQREIDRYWSALTANGGEDSMCGWLKDRFGVSWQLVPVQLERWMNPKTPERAQRVMTALLKMRKLEIAALEAAYEAAPAQASAERPLEGVPGWPKLSAPAQRALANAGFKKITDLARVREADLLKLHGFGKGSLPALRIALAVKGKTFKQ
jgi:predicted 3-demethylubiquinone-9 3-methyltransferase (glyoxalase superfamily)